MRASIPLATPPSEPCCIVGAGALGSFMAARLALAGQAVSLVGRRPAVQAIQAHGLTLHDAVGSRTVQLPAHTDIAAVRAARVVLVCVKSADTEALAQSLLPWLRPDALVVSLQNGVTNAQVLQRHLSQPVAVGLAYAAAALDGPGQVRHHGGQDLVLGLMTTTPSAAFESGECAAAAALQSLALGLRAAGFGVRFSADASTELWNKLIVNCACNAISALAQAPYGAMAAQPAVVALQDRVLQECVAVASAEGVAVDVDALRAALRRVAVNMAGQRSSTAQDLARGRHTEIDHLNGHVVQRAAAHGLAVPVNQALWALVKLAETPSIAAST